MSALSPRQLLDGTVDLHEIVDKQRAAEKKIQSLQGDQRRISILLSEALKLSRTGVGESARKSKFLGLF